MLGDKNSLGSSGFQNKAGVRMKNSLCFIGAERKSRKNVHLDRGQETKWEISIYIWQVKVRTSAGWSDYSDPARQFIADTPPGAPTISAPANGSSFNLGSSANFTWTGPAGVTIARYYLRIVPGSDLNGSPAHSSEPSGTSQTVDLTSPTFAGGSHIWSVRAIKVTPPGYNQSTYETTIGWGDYATKRTFTVSGSVVIYAAQSYAPQSSTLSMAARVIDPLYGSVTSGTFGWTLEKTGQGVINSGTGSYNSGAGQWQASNVYGSSLTPGDYIVRYTITTDRGRQGTASLPLTVGAPSVLVNGTVKDASSQAPISDAQVAIFAAGGANGLWTLVNSQYGGVMPPLSTLLAQLSPVRSVITTTEDGAFSWADVPVANSYVMVAAKSGYADAWTASFSLPATLGQTTKNLALNPVSGTLAVVGKEVASLRNKAEALLNYDAEIAGALSEQYYHDDLYSFKHDWFSTVASAIGTVGGGIGSLPDGKIAASEELFKTIGLATVKSLAEDLPFDLNEGLRVWLQNNQFPANALAYTQSFIHTEYLAALNSDYAAFNQTAPSVTLGAGFSPAKAGGTAAAG